MGSEGPTSLLSPRAITLENTLVILSTVAPDAGRYYVQAVNDKNGDNKTSQPITLTVASECGGHCPLSLHPLPRPQIPFAVNLFGGSSLC